MKLKKLLATMLIAVMALQVIGCGQETPVKSSESSNVVSSSTVVEENNKETEAEQDVKDFSKKLHFTVAVSNLGNEAKDDDFYKMITEKFNIEFDEIESISSSAIKEQTNIMITGGTMPDLMFGRFEFPKFQQYVDQGLIKALPDDYETRYPNIASELERTMVKDDIEAIGDGKVYAIVRAASFGVQYGVGNEFNVNQQGFVYRKDWAEELGIEVTPVMTYNAVMDMAKKFMEADLGKVGAENTVGIVAEPRFIVNAFMASHNINYDAFYKKDGQYVAGFNDEGNLKGIKAFENAINEGILHPNFYALKSEDVTNVFLTGKSGLYYSSWGSSYPYTKKLFSEANPELANNDCIGVFAMEGSDGVLQISANMNQGSSAVYFNPDIDEEKFERILSVIDWISSDEGTLAINYGIEGKDYTLNADGTVNILIPKNESGSYPALSDLYPSWTLFQNISSSRNVSLSTNMDDMKELTVMLKAKIDHDNTNLKELDIPCLTYAGEKYTQFFGVNDFNAIYIEAAMSGNAEKAWKDKLATLQKSIDEVLEEMNNELVK